MLPTRRAVSKAGQPIHLTRKEYDILFYLMTHAGRAVTYGKLLTSVWGPDYRQEVDYLRTFIRQLRKEDREQSDPKYLLTDAYIGYRFADLPSVAGIECNPKASELDQAMQLARTNSSDWFCGARGGTASGPFTNVPSWRAHQSAAACFGVGEPP